MKQVKHYKIVQSLGKGGMGEVFKAFDSVLERDVAIKVMHKHLLEDVRNDERFMSEARVAAKLVHPNIVTIHEVDEADFGRYIVMEFVQGTSLRDLIRNKGTLKPESSIKFAGQMLSGLQLAHSMGILHRDIKSDNILITSDDQVKILDFGIAKIMANEGLTVAGDILGTVEYMAPEQLLGEGADNRSDLYAAGVVLYQILTNQLPFAGESPAALLSKKLNEEPVPPSYYNSAIDQRLDQVILKALSTDKEERWESAEAFAAALDASLKEKSESGDVHLLDEISGLNLEEEEVEPDRLRSTFVGREKELKKLIQLFGFATRGQGRAAIIMGEAGVGKSTLASKLREYARYDKAVVLYGACLYQEGMDAYLPYVDAFREFFSGDSRVLSEEERDKLKDAVREKVPLLMEFTERLMTSFGAKTQDPISDNVNIFEGIQLLIQLLAGMKPVVFIIDDLQWADEGSLRLFHYLSSHLSRNRVLILGISRSDRHDLQRGGQPSMFLEVLARMRREGVIEEIQLHEFNQEHCEYLIDHTLSRTLFADEFYKSIYHETKGNPFFVLETLKLLRDNEFIYLDDGVWKEKPGEFKLEVPQRVEDVFVRRLSVLNEEERELLQVAAVQGYKFDASLLSQLMEMKKITLLKILQRIERELQILTSTDDGFLFDHPMLRDLLYDETLPVLRREYHQLIATELEKIYAPDYGAFTGDIAQHFRQGGDHLKAIPFLHQAGVRAFNISAYREASLFFKDFLDSVEKSGKPMPDSISISDLYFKIGISHEEGGRYEEGLDAYDKLFHISKDQEDPRGQIDAGTRIGRIHGKMGQWEKSLAYYEECIRIAEENEVPNMLCRIHNDIGVIHFQRGDFDEATKYFEQTLREALDCENAEFDWAHALTNLGIIANIRGEHGAALESYKQAISIYERIGNRAQDVARGYHNIGMTLMDMQDWSESIIAFERCLKLADEAEDNQLRAMTLLNMGKTHVKQKNIAEAKKFTEKALKFFKRTGDVLNEAESYHVFGLIEAEKGNFPSSERFLKESIRINEDKRYQEGLAESYVSYGDVCRGRGDTDRAREHYQKALEIFTEIELSGRAEELSKMMGKLPKVKKRGKRLAEVQEA